MFSTNQVAGALSEGLSMVHRDDKHNTKRQQIRSSAKTSGGQLVSGFKGFGHGIMGGIKSLTKPFVGVSQGGLEVSPLFCFETAVIWCRICIIHIVW